jgi:hypothetical protein
MLEHMKNPTETPDSGDWLRGVWNGQLVWATRVGEENIAFHGCFAGVVQQVVFIKLIAG